MPEPIAAPMGAGATSSERPDPSLWHLLWPKYLTIRARGTGDRTGRGARLTFLSIFGFLFWAFVFGMLYRLLLYFRGVEEIGPLLAGKLLGMLLVGFFSILLLSNVITALSSFFLAKDLDLLVAGPVDWLNVYLAKLAETVINSSWMVVLMAIPMFAAYGIAYHGGLWFPLVAAAVLTPLLIIPGVIGSATTLILVNVFPARRARDILMLMGLLLAAAAALGIRRKL